MIYLHLAIVFSCIFIGVRLGGAGLGLMGSIGAAILIFIGQFTPVAPPVDVMLIILAVICAASALQAAGGLEFLVSIAEKILRKHPKRITFLAPFLTYIFTFGAGTGHVAYALMPVISEVALKAGIRPERPMAVAAIASQQAITVSPISAATAAMISCLAAAGHPDISLGVILLICFPSTFIGCMIAAFVMSFYGKELKDDPIYQERLKNGEIEIPTTTNNYVATPQARLAVTLFLLGAVSVVILGLIRGATDNTLSFLMPLKQVLFERLDPATGKVTVIGMPTVIEIIMLVIAALITLFCKIDVAKITKGSVFDAGIMAVIAIFGVAWMGDIFFAGHKEAIITAFGDIVKQIPWLFAIALFLLSILLYSQAATTRILMPVGLGVLGINPYFCIGMFPAVNGYFFIPSYPTCIAAINFDPTGTTKIGKYVLNHSFMLPGLVATISAILIGLSIAMCIM